MNKLSAYTNELISLAVMFLLLAALIAGQLNPAAGRLAIANDDISEISHVRLEDE
jgi:hypothetical protein